MTEIKAGFIGKLNMLHEEAKNWFYSHYDLQGQIVIVTDVKEDSFSILNESFNCVLQKQDFVVKSTRLKPELREGLKVLYNHFSKIQKIKREIEQLNVEARNIQNEMLKEQEKMQAHVSTLTSNNISKIIPNIYSKKVEKDELKITIGFEQRLDKYVREDDYPFIYLEYDNTLHIDSVEQAIKEVGLDIKRFTANVNAIKDAAKNSKGIKFLGITDDVWIGDKNTLYVAKLFTFSIKRSLTLEDVKSVFEPINNHIEIMDNYFQNKY